MKNGKKNRGKGLEARPRRDLDWKLAKNEIDWEDDPYRQRFGHDRDGAIFVSMQDSETDGEDAVISFLEADEGDLAELVADVESLVAAEEYEVAVEIQRADAYEESRTSWMADFEYRRLFLKALPGRKANPKHVHKPVQQVVAAKPRGNGVKVAKANGHGKDKNGHGGNGHHKPFPRPQPPAFVPALPTTEFSTSLRDKLRARVEAAGK